jgi:hypothetical protein
MFVDATILLKELDRNHASDQGGCPIRKDLHQILKKNRERAARGALQRAPIIHGGPKRRSPARSRLL